ncbi:MAG: hypothetical protein CVU56_20490 [Deltaproteobacteria bacterium HGW-Deltaproteobacteria-14]|nr:MAG: hypothetical protein CVU56_20490 [Deltaproteobacteria bacterium HGW-Deltaproteobacteria-14]
MTPLRSLPLLSLALVVALPAVVGAAEPDSRDRRMVDTYRGMLADDPDQDYAFRRLLEVSHAVGGLTGLIRLYEDEVAADAGRWSAWMLLGRLQGVAENEERALMAFDRAAALRSRSASPLLGRAALFRRLRKWEEALGAYDQAVPLIRDLAARQEALKAAAEAAIEGGRADRADAYFEQLVKTEPQNLFLRMQFAATLARLGQQERALAMWQEVEERARGQLKHLVIAWKEIAELQVALGRLDDAEKTWRRALAKTSTGHWERRTFIDGLIAVHRRQDRLGELIAELEPEAASNYETLVTVARLYEELANDAKALELYRAALAKRPQDVQTRQAALQILERVGTPEEIIAAWRELVRVTPGDARNELHLAGLYFQHGKKPEAYALVQQISARYPSDPGVHQHVIDLWMRYGDAAMRKKIEGEYKILMRLEPRESGHVVSLGEYYWTVDDRARARATWKSLLTMGTDRAEGHFLLAEVYADHGLFDEARGEYEQAIAAAPGEQRYARSYALLLERQGRRAEALTVWGELLDGGAGVSRATTRDARQHIITLWEQSKLLEREIGRLEAAFASDPPDREAGPFLAEAYLYLRRVDDAQRVLERLNQLVPDDVEALVGLEAVYTRQNALDKAIAVLDQLARVNSANAVDYLHRAADLALTLGDAPLALRYARQVVELNSVDPEAQIRVGDLYARMGYRPEAAEAWRQAMVLDPRNDTVRFKLAGLYRDMGQPLREEQTLVEILRNGRDPSDALRAGRRLLQLAAANGRLAVLSEILEPLVLAGSGRGVYLKLLVDVYENLCRQAIYQETTPSAREAALTAIGERGLRPLLDALADNDVAVRTRALDVLELTHPAGAAPALSRLSQDNDVLAMVQAAVALGRIGSQAAVASLARMTGSAKNQEREVAIWALGLAGTAEAGRVLVDRVKRAQVRERPLIAAALGRGRHPGASPALLLLAQDRLADTRRAALWGLGRIADPAVTPQLGRVLVAGDQDDAALAAWGLGRIDDAAAHQALVSSLYASASAPEDAIWSALALPGRDDADAASVEARYERMLVRDRSFVTPPRRELFVVDYPAPDRAPGGPVVERLAGLVTARVGALLTQGDEVQTALLLDALLAGPELSLVPAGRFPGDAAANARATRAALVVHAEALIAVCDGDGRGDGVVARALEVAARLAEEAPGALEVDRVVAAATRSLARGIDARAGALRVLGRLGGAGSAGVFERVAALVDDPSDGWEAPGTVAYRVALARALGRLAPRGRAAALTPFLRDRFAPVRLAGARAVAVAGAGADGLVATLVELLGDPAPEVAVAAVAALAVQPAAQARLALEAAARGGDPRVAAAAAAALSE